jgi:hypothetical protein
MQLLKSLRGWFHFRSVDPAAVAEAHRLQQEKLTIRLSPYGRQPSVIPPTPDVLDAEREHH